MKKTIFALLVLHLFCQSFAQENRPNILLIAIDDLNDWVGVYDGHPQAKTPNIDKFAEKAVVFRNASCPGPVCGPSRSSLLSGFRPSTTGIYGNKNNMLNSLIVQKEPTLPEYFSKNGYVTISSGKIFHKHNGSEGTDHGQWAYDIWEKESGNDGANPASYYSRHKGIINGEEIEGAAKSGKGVDLVWGSTLGSKEGTKDYRTAKWFEQKLQQDYDKPFFMLAGLSKPHLPFVVPQEFYDQFGLDTLEVPEFRLDDLDDIVDKNGKKKFKPDEDFEWIEEQGLHKEVTRAYLAAGSYADECTGVILDALANSKYADNTIVMIWGDHGWHLGEKLKYRKASLWKESTQLPFIFYVPGMEKKQECFQNVNLLDIYPTLIDLCGLPQKELDGKSFQPLLEDLNTEWYPTITTKNKGNHSVMYKNWHYITHNDNGEELYDLENDPMEWENLANIESDEIDSIKQHLKTFLPNVNANEIENKDVLITKAERESMLYDTLALNNCPVDTIMVGDKIQLSITVNPVVSNNSAISWSSSNRNVAAVDSLTGMLTALAPGKAIITVTTNDGDYTDECEVVVAKSVISVNGVSIGDCPFGVLQAGDTLQLTAVVFPDDATDKSVIWSSSNTSVATVDESGFATTHTMGNAFIRVTANDIGFYDECVVLVDDSNATDARLIETHSGDTRVYPNPVFEKLNFDFPISGFKKEITIYNTLGQLLLTKTTNKSHFEIDVSDFIQNKILLVGVLFGNTADFFKVITI